MNYAQLRAFHAVAEEGSFTKAAERLHVTQPTLSGQVKLLEESYGVKLFERRGRGTQLTELGKALHAVTQRYFALEGEVEELLYSARSLSRGSLKLFADAPHQIMSRVALFKRRFPGITLELHFGNSEQVLAAIRERRADIGVLPEVEKDTQLFTQPLTRDELVIFVPRGHAWASRSSIKMEELSQERVILREQGSSTRAIFARHLAEAGVRLKETLEIEGREAVREAVAAGLGIGVIAGSEFVRDERLAKLAVRDANLTATTYAVCIRGRESISALEAFFTLLREEQRDKA